MNRFALLATYRSLTRHKLYAALNIGGLALGIAVFLVLALYVRFETSFEKWLPRHDGIYLVQTIWNLPDSPFDGPSNETMGGLLDQLIADFPGTVGTRIRGGEHRGSVTRAGVAVSEKVVQVDASFFDVFDLPMERGDGHDALRSPANTIISASAARRYFGNRDPIGKVLTISVDDARSYRITGVFRDIPRNSDLDFSIIVPLPRQPPSDNWFRWGSTSLRTFLRFDTAAAAKAFEQKLGAFVDRRGLTDLGENASRMQRLALLPIDRMHLEPQGRQSAGRKMTVTTLGLVGLMTLLIAVVNYVNLATARAGLRAREVAMRKVVGADARALIVHYLGEAILTVAISGIIGLMLAELSLPLVNAAGGLSLTIPYSLVAPALVVLVVLVGVVAGFYPAVLLSRFPAAGVLASARAPGGGRTGARVREALVVVQFGLAIAFMIGTFVLISQTRHVRQTDLGFERKGLLVIRSLSEHQVDPGRRRAFVAAVQALPGVRGVALANSAVGGSGENNSDNVPLPGVAGPGPSLRWIIVGPRFFEVHGSRLLAGRTFDDAHGADDAAGRMAGGGINIVIDRPAVSALGFRSPQQAVGRTVGGGNPRTIIGVVDEMRFFSPREPSSGTYYVHYRRPEETETALASIRFSGDPAAMLATVRDVWQRTIPQVPFDGATADARHAEFYRDDERVIRLFAIGTGLAVLIGCVGLWGLASFNTARRIKEIGIRKTLGASSTDVTLLLVGQFLRPVLLANLIAWPIGFFAMRTWLAGFQDRIALSPLYFVAAGSLAVVIAVITVLTQSLRASRAAPAWALRHE